MEVNATEKTQRFRKLRHLALSQIKIREALNASTRRHVATTIAALKAEISPRWREIAVCFQRANETALAPYVTT